MSWGVRRWRREAAAFAAVDKVLESAPHRYQADVDQGVMQLVQIDEVCQAWSVDELEDFGPGYILHTKSDEYIYLCGQVIEEEHDLVEEQEDYEVFPKEHISLEVWPVSQELVSVTSRGAVVEPSGSVDLSSLGVDLLTGFHVFDKPIQFNRE